MKKISSYLALGTVALVALSALAFWPLYLSKPFRAADGYTHFHAAVGTGWLALLLVQSLLIRGDRRSAHRLLGRASFVVAPAFVVSSVLLAHFRFSRMDETTFAREAYTLYLPVSASVLFAAAFVCALVWRRPASVHARFMACTGLLLLDPVLGRCLAFYLPALPEMWHYQVITFGTEALLVGLLLRTLPAGLAGRPAFRTFAGVYVAVLLLWFIFPPTAPWRAFATWFRGLALT